MLGAEGEKKVRGEGAPLDTLALVGTNVKISIGVETKEALLKRARSKYYTRAVATQLAELRSPLEKSYRNSIYCSHVVQQTGTTLTSRYCKARWCTVCNRIRTAKLIKGYGPALDALQDPFFVTLTVVNVPAPDLRSTIEQMTATAQRIQGKYKKRRQRGAKGWQLVGLRKLECTYSDRLKNYHPHFHYIVEGEEAARALVADWLRANPTAKHKAQHSRPADAGANHELFKYFSKLVTKQADGRRVTNTVALDVIFQAMKGSHVFQAIGITRVPEDIEDLQSIEADINPDFKYWQWLGNDWADIETGECLTGYIPSPAMEQLIADIL